MEDGKSYRLSLVWWDSKADFGEDAPRFIKASRYYKEGLGYVIHDNDNDKEYRELLKDRPRDVFATIVIVWETDDGVLDSKAYGKGKGFKVMPWIMSQDKLSTLLVPISRSDLERSISTSLVQRVAVSIRRWRSCP